MIKLFLSIFIIILQFQISEAVFADRSGSATFTVNVPSYHEVKGIGVVSESQNYGLPDETPTIEDLTFGRLVAGSYSGDQWELTTNKPIGISIDCNANARITLSAELAVSTGEGFVIPDARVYPSKIIFQSAKTSGETNRIFKFYPIIRVYQYTPPGDYNLKMDFTVLPE